jgi:putative phage-type endonuclease
MLTTEQLAARKIGGSSTSTIAGLNPYQTAYQLWEEMTGRRPPLDLSEKDSVVAGNLFEAPIADFCSYKIGKAWGREVKLHRVNETLVHPKYDFLTAHIDRRFVGEKRGLEIKNVGFRMAKFWGQQGTDEIAPYYMMQPHHYMLVMDYPVWTVAAYFGGDDLRLYEVERDKEMDELIIEMAHNFWHNHVIADVPPPLDYESKATLPLLKEMYPGTNGQILQGGEDLLHWMKVREDAKDKAAMYDKVAEAAGNHILAAMGEAAALKFQDGSGYTRKVVKRKPITIDACEYIDFRFTKNVKE